MFPYRGTNPENWHLVYKQLWKKRKVCRCAVPFGGMTPSGFDCSGFIHYVFNKKGILLPRAADEQFGRGERVSVNRLEPGDLVFFPHTSREYPIRVYIWETDILSVPPAAAELLWQQ